MVIIIIFPPFQAGGTRHSPLQDAGWRGSRRGGGGGRWGNEGALSSHTDIIEILVGPFLESKTMYIRLLMSDITAGESARFKSEKRGQDWSFF